MVSLLLVAWAGCLVGGTLIWGWSLVRRDVSIVDIFWGLGFVAVTWWGRSQGPVPSWFHLVHVVAVTLWGVRLGVHIWWRGRGEGEDRRYAAMRAQHGRSFAWRSLATVFWLQATLVALLAAPLVAVQIAPGPRSAALFGVGMAIWGVGFVFEAVADAQLVRFKSDPANRGKVLDSGLWRYSRHPNYFGEAVLWWGYGIAAVAVGAVWALFSPLVMTVLLLRVSGVTLLEKSIVDRRPAYAAYQRRTSAFLPLPPRTE